jgi:ABC-type nitrate/sulfonate/bicarbonate transport system permease component
MIHDILYYLGAICAWGLVACAIGGMGICLWDEIRQGEYEWIIAAVVFFTVIGLAMYYLTNGFTA